MLIFLEWLFYNQLNRKFYGKFIEYRGNPKQYVSVVLDAINLGRLTYDGVANCEQTFRALASVVDVISPKNGKTLSVETLVSYEKKKRAGEFEEK